MFLCHRHNYVIPDASPPSPRARDRRTAHRTFRSPVLLAARGRPSGPADLGDWPLLYDLGWDADWAYWFARQGQATPDLSRTSDFRLYSMLVQAAVTGLGAAIGRPTLPRPPPAWADRKLIPLCREVSLMA